MNDINTEKNEIAWNILFTQYHILDHISSEGFFVIPATSIREFREPRLMTKFDHSINLPTIFQDNKLAILPTTRGEYIIGHFENYHRFEPFSTHITTFPLPSFLESIDPSVISSETVALNCASASGILLDFLEEMDIYPTVAGRMGSGEFSFNIQSSIEQKKFKIHVQNAQIEIDGAFEGVETLSILEVKRDLSDDFLIRQLYYPFRLWKSKLIKKVRPIFMTFSNGIYRLFEYEFENFKNYNSLRLIKQKNYSIESTSISILDIENVFSKIHIKEEPHIAFPQADKFERLINICELLQLKPLDRNEITTQYAFDVRQTNYYTDAARYLGLIQKDYEGKISVYRLTQRCETILKMNFKNRQLAFCECILEHKIFHDVMGLVFQAGRLPSKQKIVALMKVADLFQIESESTFERRASTIRAWIDWILSLSTEE